ncbi:MAG: DUF3418 domain-containing protein [Gammaproteobacteria bacterium]|nr:DUF3418 domain-containing protein [Gammaproteobacteria bacterium]
MQPRRSRPLAQGRARGRGRPAHAAHTRDRGELESRAGRYPDSLRLGAAALDLRYRFAPGEPSDGVSVGVPLPLVNQFDPDTVGRQIPGWYAQRVEALIRTLPKSRRRALQPLARTAAALSTSLETLDGDELDNLAAELNRRFGLDVRRDEFDPARLPEHLSLRVELVDDGGAIVDAGRDFTALRARHGARAAEAFSRGAAEGYPRRGLVEWDFGPVPESVALSGYDTAVSAFPALVDRGDHVDLELLDNPGEARAQHAAGVLRLVKLTGRRLFRELSRTAGLDRTAVRYAGLYPGANLAETFRGRGHRCGARLRLGPAAGRRIVCAASRRGQGRPRPGGPAVGGNRGQVDRRGVRRAPRPGRHRRRRVSVPGRGAPRDAGGAAVPGQPSARLVAPRTPLRRSAGGAGGKVSAEPRGGDRESAAPGAVRRTP